MNKIQIFCIAMLVALISACTTKVPAKYTITSNQLELYPDYQGVTVPRNIAPLNFAISNPGDDCLVEILAGKMHRVYHTKDMQLRIDADEWESIKQSAGRGGNIRYTVYIQHKDKWAQYPSFDVRVVPDSIDRYITYRLIEPLYIHIGDCGIFQYDLETGEQTEIINDTREFYHSDAKHTFCVNCHTTQKSNPANRLFYIRGMAMGMVLTYDGETKFVDPKCGDMRFSTGYSQFHPTLPYIACMSECVRQNFTTLSNTKIYQYDLEADIVLYDIEKNEITNVNRKADKLAALFCWSPDGKYLYYGQSDTIIDNAYSTRRTKYDIFRATFHPETKTFTDDELIFSATSRDSSASTPKITPDGRYMIFRMGSYGMYQQTNKSTDVYCLDLKTKEYHPLDSINSPQPDHFHDVSSTGRWIMVESKKLDGNFARVYFSYFDKDGVAHKPFALPHEDPLYDHGLMKSYNCTEFTTQPSITSGREMMEALQEAKFEKAKFGSKIDSSRIDAASGASRIDGASSASQIVK